MIHKINETVCVSFSSSSLSKKLLPQYIEWRNHLYKVAKVGLHHNFRQGKTLYHVFSVTDNTLFFRLVLNSESLQCTLEEISDGETN